MNLLPTLTVQIKAKANDLAVGGKAELKSLEEKERGVERVPAYFPCIFSVFPSLLSSPVKSEGSCFPKGGEGRHQHA